jgi:hypothetical protein
MEAIDMSVKSQIVESQSIDAHVEQLWLSSLSSALAPVVDSAETALLLRSLISAFALRHDARTLGQRLENVAPLARHGKAAVWLMWIAWTVTPYAWQRLVRDRRQRADTTTAAALIERALTVASLLNTLAFLWHGRYATLYARLFGVRLVAKQRGAIRNAASTGMWMHQRELVWQGATELLLTLAPVLDLRRIAVLLKRYFGGAGNRQSDDDDDDHDNNNNNDDDTTSLPIDDQIDVSASSSSSEPCMFCGQVVLQRAALKCCRDAMACYWCACSERRLGGACARCGTTIGRV